MTTLTEKQIQNIFKSEYAVFELVIRNELDDIRDRLSPDLRRRVEVFEKQYWDALYDRAAEISGIVIKYLARDKYLFAEEIARFHPAGPALFTVFKVADTTEVGAAGALIRQLRKRTSTAADVRHVLGDPTLLWACCE